MISFTTTPAVVNGLFGVPKDDGKIRLIIDARAANIIFDDPVAVELPTPDLIARMHCPTGGPVWVAKSDLSDFYFRFRIPSWMHRYFALPPIAAGEVGRGHVYGVGTLIYPCLAVLSMGWSHSVYVAQTAHQFIIDSHSRVLRASGRITHSSDLIIDRLRYAIYIDDAVFIGTDKQQVSEGHSEYLSIMSSVDLPAKQSKVVAATCDPVKCLGFEIHGEEIAVGVSPLELDQLCVLTRMVLDSKQCTGNQMQQLVRRWTWAMLICRPALTVFTSVYRFIKCAGHRTFEIWPCVRRELVIAMRIAPLLVSYLGSNWFDKVVACDASSVGLGVAVAGDVSVSSITAAASHSGILVKPDEKEEAQLNEPIFNANWYPIISSGWNWEEHINQLELRSVSTAIRWVLSHPSSSRGRLLLLSDSQVAVGALSKGRSSSFPILRCLRPISAMLLGSGLRVYARWIASADNPADEPSRLFQ
jgi:hypothetical protein